MYIKNKEYILHSPCNNKRLRNENFLLPVEWAVRRFVVNWQFDNLTSHLSHIQWQAPASRTPSPGNISARSPPGAPWRTTRSCPARLRSWRTRRSSLSILRTPWHFPTLGQTTGKIIFSVSISQIIWHSPSIQIRCITLLLELSPNLNNSRSDRQSHLIVSIEPFLSIKISLNGYYRQ